MADARAHPSIIPSCKECACLVPLRTVKHKGSGNITGSRSLLRGTAILKLGAYRKAGSIEPENDVRMSDLSGYASRPLAFIYRYLRLRPVSHAVILSAVL